MLFEKIDIENLKNLKKIALIFNELYYGIFLKNNFYAESDKLYIDINNIFKSIRIILIELDGYFYKKGYSPYGLIHEYENNLKSINLNSFKKDELADFNDSVALIFNSSASFLKEINNLEEENEDYHLDAYKVVNEISNFTMPILNKKLIKENSDFKVFKRNDFYFRESDYDTKNNFNISVEGLGSSYNLRYQEKFDEFKNLLSSSHNDFKIKSDNLLQKFNDEINLSKLNFKKSVDDEILEFGKKFVKVNTDFKNTVKDFEVLKKFINAKGEKEVTDHYRNKAKWERITYWLMTLITFGIIIYSVFMATNGLNEYKSKANISVEKLLKDYPSQPAEKIEKLFSATQSSALTYLVLRLLFSILLFSSIIYTSRVAYRAYIHMRHSENMMLKLATLRPFINQLDESERNQIHKDLVPDYFGKDAGLVDGASEKFKDLPANVSAVAMKAIEQIGGSTSNNNSTKESNIKEPKEAKKII